MTWRIYGGGEKKRAREVRGRGHGQRTRGMDREPYEAAECATSACGSERERERERERENQYKAAECATSACGSLRHQSLLARDQLSPAPERGIGGGWARERERESARARERERECVCVCVCACVCVRACVRARVRKRKKKVKEPMVLPQMSKPSSPLMLKLWLRTRWYAWGILRTVTRTPPVREKKLKIKKN